MAGETQLQIFLTANIASFQEQLRSALSTFQSTTSSMKGIATDLALDLSGTTIDAAAAFAELNPAIQESAANYLRVREAVQAVAAELAATESIIADAGGIEGVNNDIIARWSAETTSQILLQKELTAAMAGYKSVLSDTFAAQQADIKLKQDQAVASRNAALMSAEAAASEYAANTGAAASEAEATAEEDARTAALARLIGLKEADAATTRAQTVQTVQATEAASAGYERLAAAKIANARAQAEVSAAQSNAVDLIGLESTTTNELALALERASVASAELSAAQAVLSGATNVASESMSLFRSRMIVGENGLRAFITTSLTSLPLLAAVFATTFAVRATDAMDEVILRTADLARATGIAQTSIVALGHAAEETGAKSDDLESTMRRLDRTISDALSGSKEAALSLKELGVDVAQFHGVIPPTVTVLAQMADYLKLNGGNAEVMRAGMRALGTDSPQLIAWLSQGATGIQEQADKYVALGNAETAELRNARDLKSQEEQLGATWDSLKLSILGATNAAIGWLFVNKPADGDIIDQTLGFIASRWRDITGATQAATKANSDYMTGVLKGVVAAPQGTFGAGGLATPTPPDIATPKPTPTKKVPFESQMSEFREELSQREASFEGSEADKLQMERDFWSSVLDLNRASGKDIIAVQTEIARATVGIHKEDLKQEEDTDKEIADIKQRSVETAKRELTEMVAQERASNLATVEDAKYEAAIKEEDARAQLQQENVLFGLRRDHINSLASADIITKSQQRKALEELTAAEEEAALRALQAQLAALIVAQDAIAGLKGEERAFDELGRKIVDVYRQIGILGAQTWAKNTQEAVSAAQRMAQVWNPVFTQMETGFNRAINSMIEEQGKFGTIMAQTWNKIVLSAVDSLAKILLQSIKNSIQQVIITQQQQASQTAAVVAGQSAQTAAVTAGASAQSTVGIAASLKAVLQSAYRAAAGAYGWIMSEVPWPANVPLAVAGATAAFAATLAFGGGGSAAMGAVLGEDSLIAAHAGEMIIPAGLSKQLTTAMSLPSSVSRGLSGLASNASVAGSSVSNNSTSNRNISVEQNFHGAGAVSPAEMMHNVRLAIKRGM